MRVQQNFSLGSWAEFRWRTIFPITFGSRVHRTIIYWLIYYDSMYYRIITFEGRVLGAMEDNSPAASCSQRGQREQCDFLFLGANTSTFASAPLDSIDVLLKYWIDLKLHKSDHFSRIFVGWIVGTIFLFSISMNHDEPVFFGMTLEIPFIGRTGGAIPIWCGSRHEKLRRGSYFVNPSPLSFGVEKWFTVY